MMNNINEDKKKQYQMDHEKIIQELNIIIEKYYENDECNQDIFENVVKYVNDINEEKFRL